MSRLQLLAGLYPELIAQDRLDRRKGENPKDTPRRSSYINSRWLSPVIQAILGRQDLWDG